MARERNPQKPGYGFMFPKKDRKGNEPNVTGRIRLTPEAVEAAVRGEELELAAWTKDAASGAKYQSLVVRHITNGDPMAQPEHVPPSVRVGGDPTPDDDIPF